MILENKKITMACILFVLVLVICSCGQSYNIPQNDVTTDNFSDKNEIINKILKACYDETVELTNKNN